MSSWTKAAAAAIIFSLGSTALFAIPIGAMLLAGSDYWLVGLIAGQPIGLLAYLAALEAAEKIAGG